MKTLLFTLLLCIGACLGARITQDTPLASVMENSTVLHKCNAFFYTSNTLLVTASCVSCSKCDYKIVLSKNSIIGNSKIYDIEKIIIHPNYTHDPYKFNIAKLILKVKPKNVIIYKPALPGQLTHRNGSFYTWRYNCDKKFVLTHNTGAYVHSGIYRRATGRKLPEQHIAMMSYSQITVGPYDEGSPFFVFENNEYLVYGFFLKPRLESPKSFFSLMSIPALFQNSLRSFFYDS